MEQQQENIEPENIPDDLIDEFVNAENLDIEATIYFTEGYNASMYGIQGEEDKDEDIDYLSL